MPARDFAEEWADMRRRGVGCEPIGARFGFNATTVSNVTVRLGPFPVPTITKRDAKAVAARSVLTARPAWTFPGPDLLQVAHEARDEIRLHWRAS